MKKLLLFFLQMLLPIVANAEDVAIANADGVTIYYNYINNGTELEVTFHGYNHEAFKNEYTGIVVIPDEVAYMNSTYKVTRINKFSFRGCDGLTSVIIGGNVTNIGYQAFYGCTGLTSVAIGENVVIIDRSAFFNCSMTSITIPNSVTTIENDAFSTCNKLTSLTIGDNVTTIGNEAFYGCTGLTSITIPNNVTIIKLGAFRDCTGLTSVTLGRSLMSIERRAFEGVDLKTIISLIENPSNITGKADESSPFSQNTYNSATLYVPKGTIDKYRTAGGWKDFVNIEENSESGGSETEIIQRCEKPTISYSKGKLTFNCATSGATCKYSINDTDIKSGSGNEVQLGVTYNISVYATKSGYEDSETATATLCWIDVDPKTEGIVNGVASVRSYGVMIQASEGFFNISGLETGTPISVYNTAGQMVGAANASANMTTVNTTLRSGEIGIVKIGDKSVKVLMK